MVFRPADNTASKTDTILSSLHGLQKPSPVYTVCCWIHKWQLKLNHVKNRLYTNQIQKHCRLLWAQIHLRWTGVKWKTQNLKFCLESMETVSSRLKRRGNIWLVLTEQFKNKHPLVHMALWVTCPFVKAPLTLNNIYRFEAKYAAKQTMPFSGTALLISTRQCQTTFCTFSNSMAQE